jgi:hypothetical protein
MYIQGEMHVRGISKLDVYQHLGVYSDAQVAVRNS